MRSCFWGLRRFEAPLEGFEGVLIELGFFDCVLLVAVFFTDVLTDFAGSLDLFLLGTTSGLPRKGLFFATFFFELLAIKISAFFS